INRGTSLKFFNQICGCPLSGPRDREQTNDLLLEVNMADNPKPLEKDGNGGMPRFWPILQLPEPFDLDPNLCQVVDNGSACCLGMPHVLGIFGILSHAVCTRFGNRIGLESLFYKILMFHFYTSCPPRS